MRSTFAILAAHLRTGGAASVEWRSRTDREVGAGTPVADALGRRLQELSRQLLREGAEETYVLLDLHTSWYELKGTFVLVAGEKLSLAQVISRILTGGDRPGPALEQVIADDLRAPPADAPPSRPRRSKPQTPARSAGQSNLRSARGKKK